MRYRARNAALVVLTLICPHAAAIETIPNPPAHALTLPKLQAEWHRGRGIVSGVQPGCALGLKVEERGQRIIATFPPATAAGLQAGDMLVAVDTMRLADGAAYELFAQQLSADDIAAVSVDRDGERFDVMISCGDRGRWRDRFVAAFDRALDGSYQSCIDITHELDRIAGPRAGHAKLRFECARAGRLARGQPAGHEDVRNYYEIYRRFAAPARHSNAYRKRIRPAIERAAARLRDDGSDVLADQLLDSLGAP